MFRAVVVAFGVLTFCCSYGLAVDCDDKASRLSKQRQCFTDYGLPLNWDTEHIQDALHKDIDSVCQKPGFYKLALECALDVSRECLSDDLLPNHQQIEQGITYLCDNKDSIDGQCIEEQSTPMQQCMRDKEVAYFAGAEHNKDSTFVVCKVFEMAMECAREKLSGCRDQTMVLLVYYFEHFWTPPACKQSNQGYRVTTVAPMVALELVTGVPVLPEVSCYSQSSIQDGQQKCFDQQGIVVELPNIDLTGGRQAAKKSYLDAILSNSKDFHAVCRKLPKYQLAMGCAMEVARQCMPSDYKGYLPDSRKIQLMLAELCRHVDDINQKCVTSKASALYDCGYRKGTEHRSSDVKSLLCNAFKYNTQCQKEVLPPCGCKTTRLYVDIAKRYLNPPACSPNYDTVPQCIEGTDQFAYTGVATQSVASVGVMAFTGVLAFLFFM